MRLFLLAALLLSLPSSLPPVSEGGPGLSGCGLSAHRGQVSAVLPSFLTCIFPSCSTRGPRQLLSWIHCASVPLSPPLSAPVHCGVFLLVLFSALVALGPVCLGSSVCSPLPGSPTGSAFLCCFVVGFYCCPAWSFLLSFGTGLPGWGPLMVVQRS